MRDVLTTAQALINEVSLCDHCLGRLFAKLSYGLSNAERGKALRVCLAMITDTEIKEPGRCEICEDRFTELSKWAERAFKKVCGVQFNSFHMGTKVPAQIAQKEGRLQEKYNLAKAGNFSHEFNREVGKRFEDILRKKGERTQLDLKNPDVVLVMDLLPSKVEVQINPIFIGGRYRKLIRGIPQTKWPCRKCKGKGCPICDFTGKKYPESVEELISPPVLEAAQGSDSSFHGAGREDIDALMLGKGRPFILEIKEPKTQDLDLAKLQVAINHWAEGKIEVKLTRFVDKDIVRKVKNKKLNKTYRARISLSEVTSKSRFQKALGRLKGRIKQRTPQRVSHRRADRVRKRRVLQISGKLIDNKRAVVKVKGEGGLYIKELISGDGGRTQPNLSDLLGISCEVSELDVMEVENYQF